MPAVTKHRPCAGAAGDVPVSCLAPAVGGRGGPSPARGLPAAAITQRRWPWGGQQAVSICSRRGAAPRGEGVRGPLSPLACAAPPAPNASAPAGGQPGPLPALPAPCWQLGGRVCWALAEFSLGLPWGLPHTPMGMGARALWQPRGPGHAQPCPCGAGAGDGRGAVAQPWRSRREWELGAVLHLSSWPPPRPFTALMFPTAPSASGAGMCHAGLSDPVLCPGRARIGTMVWVGKGL